MPSTTRPLYNRTRGRRLGVCACLALLATLVALGVPSALERGHASALAFAQPASSTPPDYAADRVIVGYRPSTSLSEKAHTSAAGWAPEKVESRTRVLTLKPGASVASTLRALRKQRDVLWAVPDYVAHASGELIPNDTGEGHTLGGWQALQWNFVGPFGIKAPQAWSNAAEEGAPGGKGVVVAVLDTGVAYATRGPFRRSPDFSRYGFVPGYDFIARNKYPSDRNGHGTFVAGTIAEATNNGFGLTGLAFAAKIMPVRVLDNAGEGDASVIAEGIRFAVRHGAQVINLSLEFSSDVTAADVPELTEALRYAYRHSVVVVAAAGNEGSTAIPYPARGPHVIAVGATTEHGCLAAFSNYGRKITLVAPGGGPDASLAGDPNCSPELPPGRDIFQMTFTGTSPSVFGFPLGYEGTSMAAPHVAATAALIIAGGILGRKPTPLQILARLRATARALGGASDHLLYGAGLLDAGAATERSLAGTTRR